jgi:hypothetical protein
MKLGRRPLFFFAIAATFLFMLIPTPAEFRWLNLAMAGLALFWGILLALEELLADRMAMRDDAAAAADQSEGDEP